MSKRLGLGLLLLLGAAAGRAEAPAFSERGLEVGLHLSALSVFNASPLSYGPLELGWRFGNGVRVRGGINLFYYEGMDRDAKRPTPDPERYSYEMSDLRASVEYVVPLPSRLRPVAGLSVDLIGGSRQRVVSGLTAVPKIEAWTVLAPGALLGLDLRVAEHWSLGLQGRYAHGFTETGPIASADLGWHYLF